MHTPVLSRALAAPLIVVVLSVFAADAHAGKDTSWDAVLHRHVHNGSVAYADLKSDSDFHKAIAHFENTNPSQINDPNDRLAFWINAYNAFTMQLIVDHYPVKSIKDVNEHPWDTKFIRIHGETYSLNHIENAIIRKQFSEPRIHFALVCAAKGCPPIRNEAYVGATLDKQLQDNARAFMSQSSKNRFDAATGTLHLSSIFDWYKTDFIAKAGSVQEFVRPFYPSASITAQTPVQFTDYDWSLNGR